MYISLLSGIENNQHRNPNINKQTNDDDAWFEVLMLLMTVINPRECLFRNGKHCCFCVCSYRVDVRMSAASGGKFCVNIFCFRILPHIVWSLHFASSSKKHVASRLKSSEFNMCCWDWMQFLLLIFVPFSVSECVLQIYYHGRHIICSDIICALCQDVNNILLPRCFC